MKVLSVVLLALAVTYIQGNAVMKTPGCATNAFTDEIEQWNVKFQEAVDKSGMDKKSVSDVKEIIADQISKAVSKVPKTSTADFKDEAHGYNALHKIVIALAKNITGQLIKFSDRYPNSSILHKLLPSPYKVFMGPIGDLDELVVRIGKAIQECFN